MVRAYNCTALNPFRRGKKRLVSRPFVMAKTRSLPAGTNAMVTTRTHPHRTRCSITMVPAEVLIKIILETVGDMPLDAIDDFESLAAKTYWQISALRNVCAYWRQAVHMTSPLWTMFNMTHLSLVQESISYYNPYYLFDIRGCVSAPDDHGEPIQDTAWAAQLGANARQIRSLEISAWTRHEFSAFFEIFTSRSPISFPNLQYLRLTQGLPSLTSHLIEIPFWSSSLRRLELRNIDFDIEGDLPEFPLLEEFGVSLRHMTPNRVESIHKILGNAPNLQHIFVDCNDLHSVTSSASFTAYLENPGLNSIKLLNLRILEFRQGPDSLHRYLCAALDMPRLELLRFWCMHIHYFIGFMVNGFGKCNVLKLFNACNCRLDLRLVAQSRYAHNMFVHLVSHGPEDPEHPCSCPHFHPVYRGLPRKLTQFNSLLASISQPSGVDVAYRVTFLAISLGSLGHFELHYPKQCKHWKHFLRRLPNLETIILEDVIVGYSTLPAFIDTITCDVGIVPHLRRLRAVFTGYAHDPDESETRETTLYTHGWIPLLKARITIENLDFDGIPQSVLRDENWRSVRNSIWSILAERE